MTADITPVGDDAIAAVGGRRGVLPALRTGDGRTWLCRSCGVVHAAHKHNPCKAHTLRRGVPDSLRESIRRVLMRVASVNATYGIATDEPASIVQSGYERSTDG